MNEFWIGFIAGIIIPGIGAAFGWIQWWYQIREKRHEKSEKEKAQAELALIHNRGDAPFFASCMTLFDQLYCRVKDSHVQFVPASNGNILCYARDEVSRDAPPGTKIYFVIENRGQSTRQTAFKLDGEPIELGQEPKIQGAQDLDYFAYLYNPDKHGKLQNIEVWFETASGVQATHIYQMQHGKRYLKRINPQ